MCMQPSIGILSSSDEVMTPGRVRTDLLWKKKKIEQRGNWLLLTYLNGSRPSVSIKLPCMLFYLSDRY